MPRLAEMNYFDHDLPLPGFYRTGATRMRCLAAAVGQSLTHAFARHRAKLEVNPRIGMMYRAWDHMAAADRRHIRRQAGIHRGDLGRL